MFCGFEQSMFELVPLQHGKGPEEKIASKRQLKSSSSRIPSWSMSPDSHGIGGVAPLTPLIQWDR